MVSRKFIIGGLLGGLLSLSVGYYVWYKYQRDISITYYEKVTPKTFSLAERKSLARVHAGCFADLRRKKVKKYIRQTRRLQTPLEESQIDRRVDEMVASEQLQAHQKYENSQFVYVVRYHGKISGMFSCHDDHDYTEDAVMLYNLCLDSELRGRGIGRQMVRHAIASCQRPNRAFALVVYQDEPWNISLYQSLGFRVAQPPKRPSDEFSFFDKVFMQLVTDK